MTTDLTLNPKADILIVDDTPNNLRLLGQILGKQYKVRLAPSGPIALTAARSAPPDLILLDIMMPELNGYEVAERLKTEPETKEIPILFISALDDADSKVRAFAAGGVDYITKPFQEKEVLARVKTHLSLRRLYKQAQEEIAERKRVEEALRESELHYRALVEGIPGIIYSFSSKSGGVYYSPHVVEILGYSLEKLYAKPMLWHDSIHPDDLPRVDLAIRDSANGKAFHLEYRIMDAHGNWHWFDDRSIGYNMDNEDVIIGGLVLDITERKQAEENIQRMAARWSIVHRADDEISASLDTEQVFVAIHHAVEQFMPCEDMVISLYDETRNVMGGEYLFENNKKLPASPYLADHGLGGYIVHTGQSVILNSPEQINGSGIKFEPYGSGPITSSVLGVPLRYKGKAIGILSAQSYHSDAYTPEDQELLEMLANHAAIAIENARLFGQAQEEIIERKRAEDALRASNAKLEILFQVSPLAITLLDSDGVVQLWNSAAEQIFGWTSQEVIGHPNPIVPMNKQNEYAAWAAQILHGKPITNQETIRQRKDGSFVDVSISSAPVYDVTGNVIGRMAILADITERKQAEEELRRVNTLMNMIVENIPNMVFLKDARELRFVQFNRAGEDLLGYSRDDLLGKNDYDFFPKEQADFFTEKDRQVLRGNEVVDIPEEPLQTRDKGVRTLHTKKVTLRDASGKPEYLLGISEDITERKRAEETLLHRNQEMANLYETSLEINALSDVSALLQAIVRRACGLLNIPSGALYLVHPDEEMLELVVGYQLPPHWIGKKIQIGEGLAGRVVQIKKPLVVEDYLGWGERLEAFHDSFARRVLGVPLKIHDQIIGVIILLDRQVGTFSEDEIRLASLFADQAAIAVSNAQFAAQLEERVAQRTSELETANRELETLSYNIAHDMRSPVRAMVGYSGMLQQTHRAQLDSEGLQQLDNIHTAGVRLGQMIDGFLTFLHLGHATLHMHSVNMNSLVSRLIKKLEPELKSRQVEFSVGDLPGHRADPNLVEQVWAQLISNALKFTRPREIARIEIGSGEADGKQYYFVRDNGVGFDMKYSAKLFGVFQKLHYESEFEGTGIGLAIIKRIIQRHGGKIWVEAEVDKGAIFYFTLKD